MNTSTFYIFTATTCFLEIAILAICIKAQHSLAVVALFMAAYHCAYLVSDWQSHTGWLSERLWGYVMMVASPLLAFISHDGLWPLALPGVLMCTAGIQTVRFSYKSNGSSSDRYTPEGKALFRYIGILAGGLAAFYPWLPAIMVCTVSIFISRNASSKRWDISEDKYKLKMPGLYRLLLFIFFHHAQYFLYVYVFLTIFHRSRGIDPFLIGATMLFGWLGYSMVEKMVQKYHRSLVSTSHIVNALILAGMSVAFYHAAPDAVLILWIASGFTGGTAYTIEAMPIMYGRGLPLHPFERCSATALHSDKLRGTKRIRNLAEHLGHVTGCLSAALLAFAGFDSSVLFLVAGGISVLAGVCLITPIEGTVTPLEEEAQI